MPSTGKTASAGGISGSGRCRELVSNGCLRPKAVAQRRSVPCPRAAIDGNGRRERAEYCDKNTRQLKPRRSMALWGKNGLSRDSRVARQLVAIVEQKRKASSTGIYTKDTILFTWRQRIYRHIIIKNVSASYDLTLTAFQRP